MVQWCVWLRLVPVVVLYLYLPLFILKIIILHYINRILYTYIIYIYSFYDINMEYILVSLVSLYINTILHSANVKRQ